MIKAIVYESYTGHTKEYAELLSKELALPCYELKSAKGIVEKNAEVIFLGWLMAGTIKGYKKAKAYFDIKALCAVGMSGTESQLKDIIKTNKIPTDLKVVLLQGGFEIEKLRGIYKLMMNTMKKTVGKALADKKDRTDEENEMLDLLINGGNRVSLENLRSVIDWYEEKGEKE